MSRGPGKWQRAILEALQTREVCYVRDIRPAPQTRSQQLAVLRAAHRLARQGHLVVDVERQHWTRGTWGAVVVARPGAVIDRLTLAALTRLQADGHLSESSTHNDPLSLRLLTIYRQAEAATRERKAAQRQWKAVQYASQVARQEEARLTFEEAVAAQVLEAVQQHIKREQQEKWQREFEAEREAIWQAVQQEQRADQRYIAVTARVLNGRGQAVTEAAVLAVLSEVCHLEPADAAAVVARLQASGDYQRLLAEALPPSTDEL